MDAACTKIKAVGKTCLALGLSGIFPAYWDFPEVARNYLTEDDMRAMLTGDMPWTDPKMVNILKGLASITQKGWANSGAPSITMLPDGADLFQSGNAAFAGTIISDAVNWAAFDKALGAENVGAMRWPTLVADAPLAGSFSGIESSPASRSWSDKKDAAFRFVKFMAGPENAELLTKVAGGISLYKNVDPSALPKSPALSQILEIIKKPTLHAGVILSGQEADALARGWQEVTLGQLSIEDWTARMQKALEQSPSKRKKLIAPGGGAHTPPSPSRPERTAMACGPTARPSEAACASPQTERRMKRRELWLALAFIVPGMALAVLFARAADPRLPSEPPGDAGLRRTELRRARKLPDHARRSGLHRLVPAPDGRLRDAADLGPAAARPRGADLPAFALGGNSSAPPSSCPT